MANWECFRLIGNFFQSVGKKFGTENQTQFYIEKKLCENLDFAVFYLQGGIRTNTTVCLGKIASYLNPQVNIVFILHISNLDIYCNMEEKIC